MDSQAVILLGLLQPRPLCCGTTKTTTTSSPSAPQPTQAGIPSNCVGFHLVQSGDQYNTIAAKYSITAAEFKQWEPYKSTIEVCSTLWLDYHVCIYIPGSTTTTSPPTPIPTGPQLQMPGIVITVGITLEQFQQADTAADATCSNL
ncbi:hypothetical protein BJX70DRAFT_388877 [Aspergillus crustosus]